jgi:pilus assembly protein FimV
MGDTHAARDITEEVLEKGSDEQKKLAKSILDSLK